MGHLPEYGGSWLSRRREWHGGVDCGILQHHDTSPRVLRLAGRTLVRERRRAHARHRADGLDSGKVVDKDLVDHSYFVLLDFCVLRIAACLSDRRVHTSLVWIGGCGSVRKRSPSMDDDPDLRNDVVELLGRLDQ